MGLREDILKRIERKRQEIVDLRGQIAQAEAAMQAFEETLKLLPREGVNQGDAATVLRPNSGVAKARDVLLKSRKPLHINELLAAMGRELTRESRGAITSSLAAYVRRGEIFTRPAPNTYGLVEFGEQEAESQPELPAEFGKV